MEYPLRLGRIGTITIVLARTSMRQAQGTRALRRIPMEIVTKLALARVRRQRTTAAAIANPPIEKVPRHTSIGSRTFIRRGRTPMPTDLAMDGQGYRRIAGFVPSVCIKPRAKS
ncbi:hypothetical protein VN12_13165 [Pirellula sp. SH-Sr6A]|nr:hypothetical protein VN12_13165 [Pirellula sp. SH-Sr6A]